MQKRILGKDLEVSAIGLGCMGFNHAYGVPTEKKEAIRSLQQAVEMGYTFFDTAEVYGPYDNEELVGEALRPYRDKMVIATKFGIHLEFGSIGAPIPDARPEVIRKSVVGSLKRLNVDYIDLYYQHRIDPSIPPEEVAGLMSDLIHEGKIRHWGVSEVNEDYLRRAHGVCPITAVENRYSMMYREYESLFPVLEELGIGFVAFSPMANGLLTDQYNKDFKFEARTDYRSEMPQFKPEAYDANQVLFELLRSTATEKNATPAQISMAWMLCKKPWIIPIPGTRKVERMKENAGASKIILTAEEIKTLDEALEHMTMSAVFGGHKK